MADTTKNEIATIKTHTPGIMPAVIVTKNKRNLEINIYFIFANYLHSLQSAIRSDAS